MRQIDTINQIRCARIKVPVVLAEADVQIMVDSVKCLPELAIKVDRVVAKVKDIEAEPVLFRDIFNPEIHRQTGNIVRSFEKFESVRKVIVSGILHKQLFFVNRNNEVKHVSEDIPFSQVVDVDEIEAVEDPDNVFVQVMRVQQRVEPKLIKASRVLQTGFIRFRVKVVEERQLLVQLCPEFICEPGVNLLQDPSFESWADQNTPVFWGSSNVFRTTIARSGNFAAELGAVHNRPASLFQSVFQGIFPRFRYRLCFFARENIQPKDVANFTLTAELIFFDRFGVEIESKSTVLTPGDIPENSYARFCLTSARTPSDVASALVRFSFSPDRDNDNTVKIDDVFLECLN